MNNVLNNTIVTVEEVRTIMDTTKATGLAEMDKQFKVVDKFVNRLFSNAPVYPRVVITKTGIEVDNILGANGPIADHKSVKYSTQLKKVTFVAEDKHGNMVKREALTGPGTNYRYTESLIKVNVANAVASQLDSIKAEYILLNVAKRDAKISVNGLVDGVPVKRYMDAGYVRYAVKSWSNSDERNGGILLYNADERTPQQAYNDLDEVFGGALSAKKAAYNGVATLGQLQKDITRNGIFNAPMMHMATIGNADSGILVVKNKLVGVEDYVEAQHEEMNSMGIEIDNYTYDGQMWMAASLMKRMVKNTFGFEITDEEACALSAQTRADVLVTKTYSATDYNEVIARIAERIMATYDYFIIGNKDKIEVIVDANGYKLMTENYATTATNVKLYVLDVARHSMSNTSGQLLEKFMVKDSARVIKYLREAAADRIDMYNTEKFSGEAEFTFTTDANGELSLQQKLIDGLVMANPERFMKDRYCMERLISENIKLQEAAVNKLKLPVKSLFLRALFDYTKLIQGQTEYILGYDAALDALECYSVSVLEANYDKLEAIKAEYDKNIADGMSVKTARRIRKEALDKVLTAVAIKYPCPGSEEFQVVRFLTLEEIAERIAEKISDAKDRELVYKMFASKGDGNILISPCNTVKNKLAGMDTDYDAVAVIFEKELVDIVIESERTNTCVCIDTKGTKPEYRAKAKAKAMLDGFQIMK